MVARCTPSTRGVAIASLVVGLVLLSAPLWIGAFDLDSSVTTYERVEVTAENGTISYTERPPGPHSPPISEDLGCTMGQPSTTVRLCALEGALNGNETGPIVAWSTDPDGSGTFVPSRYRYVRVDGAIYRPTTTVGEHRSSPPASATGPYPIFLDVERVDAERALRELSVSAADDRVPGVVRTAARDDRATARGSVTLPDRPIRLEDGTTYRVVLTDRGDPPWFHDLLHTAGRFLAPILGVLALTETARRTSIRFEAPTR